MEKVLFVADAEGFMIKGVETKIKGIGLESIFSTPKIKDLEHKVGDAALIMLFTDDSVEFITKALVYIKDHCFEHDKQIVVVGKKEEYEILREVFPDNLIYKFYERPLDMDELIKDTEKYMDESEKLSRRKSILIVDDDVSYMSMIMDWLKDAYRVSLVNSGMSAITWLAKNRPDLILLDYEMPVTSGPHVLEMIRSDSELADIPVMFLTGKGDKESVMKVLSLKPVGYMLKNVSRQELRDNLSNYFDSHKQ